MIELICYGTDYIMVIFSISVYFIDIDIMYNYTRGWKFASSWKVDAILGPIYRRTGVFIYKSFVMNNNFSGFRFYPNKVCNGYGMKL